MPSSDIKDDALQSILASLGEEYDEKHQIRNQYLERFAATFHLPHQGTVNEAQTELILDTIGTIQNNKIGIFEVPTLKEESINVICSICTWFREYLNIKKHANKDTNQDADSKKRSHNEIDQEKDDHGKDINSPTLKRNRLSGEKNEEDGFHRYSFESSTIKSQSPEPTSSGFEDFYTPSSSALLIQSGQQGKDEKGKSKAIPNVDTEEDELPDEKLVYVFRSRSRLKLIINELKTFNFIQKDFDVFEGVSDQNFSSTLQSQKIQVIVSHIDDLMKQDDLLPLDSAIHGSFIVFDEAHDILDYITKKLSVVVGQRDVQIAVNHLKTLVNAQIKDENRKALETLLLNLNKFNQFFTATNTTYPSIMSPMGLLDEDVFEEIEESSLHDLVIWSRDTANDEDLSISDKAAFCSIQTFLENLLNPNLKGWVHYSKGTHHAKYSTLKYQLLNPGIILEKAIKQARSAILLGEVMDPMLRLKLYLFPQIPNNRLVKKDYPQLIPDNNLLAGFVEQSSAQEIITFTSKNREDDYLMQQLLEMIVEYCKVIPKGVVVFIPTYTYLESLRMFWEKSNFLLATLKGIKQVFFQPNDIANATDVLQSYKDAIRSIQNGAILFTAVNSEFSEMIEFENELARAVIMVGMPFTYKEGPVWRKVEDYILSESSKIKIKHFLTKEQEEEKRRKNKIDLAEEFYVDQCFNCVNRSIGKVISHQNDFAAIILLDSRYNEPKHLTRLSEWIQTKGKNNRWLPFKNSIDDLKLFFEGR